MTWNSVLLDRLEAAGAHLGQREGAETAVDFGAADAEAVVLRQSAGLADWSFSGRLSFAGADRERFLQGQCTQDVAGLAVGAGASAFVLDPKGRNVGELAFLKREDELLALVHRPSLSAIQTWLDRFVIASDVTIEDRSEAEAGLRLGGPKTGEVLAAAGLPGLPEADAAFVEVEWQGVAMRVQRDELTGAPGALLHVPTEAARDLWDHVLAAGAGVGLRPVGYDAIDALRIENGRAWFGRDVDETVLPVESGQLDRTVSFDKGCYTGQEVVARQHFIGKPRKLLCGLRLEGDALREGDPVLAAAGERPLGHITSLARLPWQPGPLGLAVLRGHEHVPGTRYLVVPDDGREEGSAVVCALPFPRES